MTLQPRWFAFLLQKQKNAWGHGDLTSISQNIHKIERLLSNCDVVRVILKGVVWFDNEK